MGALVQSTLTPEAARVLTDEVKADAADLWLKCLRLYEGGAHAALGYSSWGAYYEAEFGQASSTGYRLLEAARVVALIPMRGNEGKPPSQNTARELVPMLRATPERVEEVWAEVVGEHGPQPTASQVRDHVRSATVEHEREPSRKPLSDEFRGATLDLGRVVDRITRLSRDDRFSRNAATVTDLYLHDLIRASESLRSIIDAIAPREELSQ